jgi:predicted transcriptional regulator
MDRASKMASAKPQADSFGEFLKVTQGRSEEAPVAPASESQPASPERIADLLKAASQGPITVPEAIRATHLSVLDLARTLEHAESAGFVSVSGSGENEVIDLTEFGTKFLNQLRS